MEVFDQQQSTQTRYQSHEELRGFGKQRVQWYSNLPRERDGNPNYEKARTRK